MAEHPLIQQLRSMRPGKLFDLAPRKTLERAAAYLAGGRVGDFTWTNGALCVDVKGEHSYAVTLQEGGREPVTSCTCPAEKPCKHGIAAMMAASHSLNGFRYSQINPEAFRVAKWARALAAIEAGSDRLSPNPATNGQPAKPASRKSGGKKGPTLEILLHENGAVEMQALTAFGKPLKWWDAPHTLRHFLRESRPDPAWLEDYLEECSSFFTIAVTHAGVRHELRKQKALAEIPGLLVLRLHKDRVGVYIEPEGSPEQIRHFVRLTETIVWDAATNRLGSLSEPLDYEELSRFRNPFFSSDDGGMPGVMEWFGAQPFNDLCLDPDVLADTRIVDSKGETVEPTTLPVRAILHIATGSGGQAATARCSILCDGVSAGHGAYLLREIHGGEAATRHSRLLTAQSRRDVLEPAFLRCVLAPDRKAHDAVVKEILGHPALEQRLHRKEAQRWLDDAARETAAMESTLLVDPSEDGRWLLAQGAFQKAACALLALRSILSWRDPRPAENGWEVSIGQQALMEALPQLVEAGVENDFSVQVDSRSVESTTLEIEVEASKPAPDAASKLDPGAEPGDHEERIDWFELHPSVRHAERELPKEALRALVDKGYYEDTDGTLRVISSKQREALGRLSVTLNLSGGTAAQRKAKAGSATAVQVPRLRVLDLLALRKMGVTTKLPPAEAAVLESLMAFRSIESTPLPSGLNASLRDYQKAGYDWLSFLYRHRFGACLADDMGLGKTLQTIALLGGIHEGQIVRVGEPHKQGLHLIVLPPTLLFNWRREIEQFFPSLPLFEHSGAARSVANLPEHGVVLTTYELARRDLAKLTERKFDVIVFDEAQAVKNLEGRRSRAMRLLRGQFRLCLTGTPLENSIAEYYAIIDLAVPGLYEDHKKFLKAVKEGGDVVLDRARPFVLRRTKDKILKELPPKIEQDIYLDASNQQKGYYTAAVAAVRKEVQEAYKDRPKQQAGIVALTALLRLRQICVSPQLIDPQYKGDSPKLEHLASSIEELAAEGQAALVFSQFVKALDLAEVHLRKLNISYVRMDGKTPPQKRKTLVGAFQDPGGPPVFLISLKTGGAGLNLTRASHVFHLDPWWNPAVEEQASDRAHRIGQLNRVFIHRLLMSHTVEEKMMVLKKRKRALFDRIVGGGDAASNSGMVSREDIEFLIGA